MVTIKIKGGTPEGSESLCRTCRWAHVVKGFSASQEQIRCKGLRNHPLVPFPVSECSSYDDKRLPSRWDMENIAWILLTKKAGRTIGFVTAKQFRQLRTQPIVRNNKRLRPSSSREERKQMRF